MTTRLPEALPFRNIKAEVIAEALIQLFSGVESEIQYDPGSNFTLGLFQEVMHELEIKQMSSTYHPVSRYH